MGKENLIDIINQIKCVDMESRYATSSALQVYQSMVYPVFSALGYDFCDIDQVEVDLLDSNILFNIMNYGIKISGIVFPYGTKLEDAYSIYTNTDNSVNYTILTDGVRYVIVTPYATTNLDLRMADTDLAIDILECFHKEMCRYITPDELTHVIMETKLRHTANSIVNDIKSGTVSDELVECLVGYVGLQGDIEADRASKVIKKVLLNVESGRKENTIDPSTEPEQTEEPEGSGTEDLDDELIGIVDAVNKYKGNGDFADKRIVSVIKPYGEVEIANPTEIITILVRQFITKEFKVSVSILAEDFPQFGIRDINSDIEEVMNDITNSCGSVDKIQAMEIMARMIKRYCRGSKKYKVRLRQL